MTSLPPPFQGVSADEWRRIPSPYRNYEVSSAGAVRRDGRELKGYVDRYGYRTVLLSYAGLSKRFKVHRLVCETFHGAAPVGMECAHLDCDKGNNSRANLKWVTHAENVRHTVSHGTINRDTRAAVAASAKRCRRGGNNPNSKIGDEEMRNIANRVAGGLSIRAAARECGVMPSTILKRLKRIGT